MEIEIITSKNELSTKRADAYDVVSNDPIIENLMKKANATVTRHLKEISQFGEYLRDEKNRNVVFMQQLRQLLKLGEWTPAHTQAMLSEWSTVTANDIRDYKNYLLYRRGCSVTTTNQTIFIIRSYAGIAAASGELSESEYLKMQQIKGIRDTEAERINQKRPVTRIGTKKADTTVITKYQAEQLKHGQPDTLRGRRDAFMMSILLDHGLRIVDVINLTMENIDMENRLISVHTQKTGTDLNLAMTDDVYDAALAYFEFFQPIEKNSIWTGVNKYGKAHGTFSKHSAQMRIHELGEILGLQNFSAHDCRHYWVTAADRGGSSLLAIVEAGGWKSTAMPARYINKNKVSNVNVKLG